MIISLGFWHVSCADCIWLLIKTIIHTLLLHYITIKRYNRGKTDLKTIVWSWHFCRIVNITLCRFSVTVNIRYFSITSCSKTCLYTLCRFHLAETDETTLEATRHDAMWECQGQGSSTLMMSVRLSGEIEYGRLLWCSQVILNLSDSVISNTISVWPPRITQSMFLAKCSLEYSCERLYVSEFG